MVRGPHRSLEVYSFDEIFGEENFSWLPSKNIERTSKTKHSNLTRKFVCLWKCKSIFVSHSVFGGSQLNFSSPKKFFKWIQVGITTTQIWNHSDSPRLRCIEAMTYSQLLAMTSHSIPIQNSLFIIHTSPLIRALKKADQFFQSWFLE